jgi:hypothetical protein
MENLGIFYDNLVYFTTIGNILFPFGIFCGNFVYFFPVLVGISDQEKSANPERQYLSLDHAARAKQIKPLLFFLFLQDGQDRNPRPTDQVPLMASITSFHFFIFDKNGVKY